jgi:hypothetical protein
MTGESSTVSKTITILTWMIRGGFVVWRAAQWYPNLVSHVFSVCTPYTAPHKQYFSTEDLVKGQLPQFAYQLHLASGEVEKSVKDEQSIRQFLRGLYGARGPNGELAFDPEKGVIAENLPLIGESRILNGKVSGVYSFFSSRKSIRGSKQKVHVDHAKTSTLAKRLLDMNISSFAEDAWTRRKPMMAHYQNMSSIPITIALLWLKDRCPWR